MVINFIKSKLGVGRNKVLQGGIDFDKMAKKLDKVLLEYKYADVKVKIRSTR